MPSNDVKKYNLVLLVANFFNVQSFSMKLENQTICTMIGGEQTFYKCNRIHLNAKCLKHVLKAISGNRHVLINPCECGILGLRISHIALSKPPG